MRLFTAALFAALCIGCVEPAAPETTGTGGGNAGTGGGTATGTGGGTSVGGGSGTGGTTGTSDGGPSQFGWVYVSSSPGGPTNATAFFSKVSPVPDGGSNCTLTTDGRCIIQACKPDGGGSTHRFQSAGTIAITGGSVPATLSWSVDAGYYQGFFNGGYFFTGSQLTITAAGDSVSAFSASVMPPSPMVVALPPVSSGAKRQVNRTQPLSVTWTGASAGSVVISLQTNLPYTAYVICTVPASDGNATIVPSVLAHLTPGEGFLMVSQQSTTEVQAGDWPISVVAATNSLTSDGGVWPTHFIDIQ